MLAEKCRVPNPFVFVNFSIQVLVGETAVLEGKVTGEPKPEIKWFSGDNVVKETSNIKLENLPDGIQRLIVKNATVEDTGEYRCVASNQYGDVWSDVTLTVKGYFSISLNFDVLNMFGIFKAFVKKLLKN